MVSWLVIVLDVGGSVIFLSSYNHHMSLEASRARHEKRAVLNPDNSILNSFQLSTGSQINAQRVTQVVSLHHKTGLGLSIH